MPESTSKVSPDMNNLANFRLWYQSPSLLAVEDRHPGGQGANIRALIGCAGAQTVTNWMVAGSVTSQRDGATSRTDPRLSPSGSVLLG